MLKFIKQLLCFKHDWVQPVFVNKSQREALLISTIPSRIWVCTKCGDWVRRPKWWEPVRW